LIIDSKYSRPPFWQFDPHLQTIAPNRMRKLEGPDFERERINTPDGDFLDIDWLKGFSDRRLVILTHGLEGDSKRIYMRGMAVAFAKVGFDILAWNNRSCSGEWPLQPKLYYHGETKDLATVIDHAIAQGYQEIVLVGFSMGASVVLKYIGERGDNCPTQLTCSVSFSCPTDLEGCALYMDKPHNRIYKIMFMRTMKAKAIKMAEMYPHLNLPQAQIKSARTWCDFDDAFTRRMWGFESIKDLYDAGSVSLFADNIKIPSLLVNAQNDPLLPPSCYPTDLARDHPYFHFELTDLGGHIGFDLPRSKPYVWSEHRAVEFVLGLNK
jgi:uncharacterized protein